MPRQRKWYNSYLDRVKGKTPSNMCKMPFISIHTLVVSNNSVRGQCRPWLDCADALTDQGLHCSNMSKDTVSHSTTQLLFTTLRTTEANWWFFFFTFPSPTPPPPQKIKMGFDVECKVCLKCQQKFWEKWYEQYFKMSSAEKIPSMLRVNSLLNTYLRWRLQFLGRLLSIYPKLLKSWVLLLLSTWLSLTNKVNPRKQRLITKTCLYNSESP